MKILLIFFIFFVISLGKQSEDYKFSQSITVVKALLAELLIPLRISLKVCLNNSIENLNFYKSVGNFDDNYPAFMFNVLPESNESMAWSNENEHQSVILLDVSCGNAVTILQKAGQGLYLNYRWILIDTNSITIPAGDGLNDYMMSIFHKFPVLQSSEVFFIYPTIDEHSNYCLMIKQIYRVTMQEPLILELFGKWTNDSLLVDNRSTRITSRRRLNLNGSQLRASLVVTHNNTLEHLQDYKDKHIDTITKVNFILTNYLMDFVNATINYSMVSTWGYKDKDSGEWSGMIGELISKKVHLGASPLFFTTDRIPVIQYIAMTSPTGSQFVFRSPKLSFTDNVFLLPFDSFVWYSLLGLILIKVFLLKIATFAEWWTPLSEIDNKGRDVLRPITGDIFLMVFGASCQQGSSVTPKSFTARTITMITFTILMFLYTSYAANIVALLQSPSTKIKTLSDLLNSRLKFGVDDTVFNRYYFSHETEHIHKAIYEQKILKKDGTDNFMPLEYGIAELRKGLFAFHMELGVGYKIISETFYEHEKCGLQEIKFYNLIDPWYAIQKNSSFKEAFKIGLFRMREHGLQDRENSRLYTKKPKCSSNNGNFITVGLVDTKPAILVWAWGIGLSISVLLIEIIMKKFHFIRIKSLMVSHKL